MKKLLYLLLLPLLVACGGDDEGLIEYPEIYVEPIDQFKTEAGVREFVSEMYSLAATFTQNQLLLEEMRMSNTGSITPYADTLRDTWFWGYNLVGNAMRGVESLKLISSFDTAPYLFELSALQAFGYYNLAMLYGDVFVLTAKEPERKPSNQLTVAEVYAHCHVLLDKYMRFADNSATDKRFTKDSYYALHCEIALAQGNKQRAKSYIDKISNEYESLLSLYQKDEEGEYTIPVPVYTGRSLALLKAEIEGTDTSQSWFSLGAEYGVWAALKRLGTAQSLTGCEEYQLLMPFPTGESLKQNPGW